MIRMSFMNYCMVVDGVDILSSSLVDYEVILYLSIQTSVILMVIVITLAKVQSIALDKRQGS